MAKEEKSPEKSLSPELEPLALLYQLMLERGLDSVKVVNVNAANSLALPKSLPRPSNFCLLCDWMVQVVRVTKVFPPCPNQRLSLLNESVTSRKLCRAFVTRQWMAAG